MAGLIVGNYPHGFCKPPVESLQVVALLEISMAQALNLLCSAQSGLVCSCSAMSPKCDRKQDRWAGKYVGTQHPAPIIEQWAGRYVGESAHNTLDRVDGQAGIRDSAHSTRDIVEWMNRQEYASSTQDRAGE